MTSWRPVGTRQQAEVRTVFGLETEYFLEDDSNYARVGPEAVVRHLIGWIEANIPSANCGATLFLANGSRCHEDIGAHLEIASPECESPDDLVRFGLAGDLLLAEAIKQCFPPAMPVAAWRGFASYSDGLVTASSHENYTGWSSPEAYEALMVPFLVTRIIYTGSGAIDWRNTIPQFVLSPRAVCICERGARSNRGYAIWSGRDEPLSSGQRRRIHITTGDGHGGEFPLWLRFAATGLVLAAADVLGCYQPAFDLEDPRAALDSVNRDPSLRTLVRLSNGRLISPFDIQRWYIDFVAEAAAHAAFPSWTMTALTLWNATIDRLESDANSLDMTLDWRLRLRALEQARQSAYSGELWLNPAPHAILQLFDSRFLPVGDSGFVQQLEACGVKRTGVLPHPPTWNEVVLGAPATTRASLRSEWILARCAAGLPSEASWNTISDGVRGFKIDKLYRDEYSARWLSSFAREIEKCAVLRCHGAAAAPDQLVLL